MREQHEMREEHEMRKEHCKQKKTYIKIKVTAEM
jgi:hypothetical protein